jgi:hypothetical protein
MVIYHNGITPLNRNKHNSGLYLIHDPKGAMKVLHSIEDTVLI